MLSSAGTEIVSSAAAVTTTSSTIPNSRVISAEGTRVHDIAHFDQESVRIMGQRYAETLLELVPQP
jgi:hypothetical protein